MSDFIWKGAEVQTIGELTDAIDNLQDEAEAKQFIAAYRVFCKYADANAGYVTGYLQADRGMQLREWMGTPHPVFGMGSPTPEEAFAMGQAIGEQWKREAEECRSA